MLDIKALRSGKYKQGKYVLRNCNTERYCCLGVLCDISKKGQWKLMEGSDGFGFDYKLANSSDAAILPWELLPKFSTVGSIEEVQDRFGNTISLIGLNDAGCTFDQIADVIEYFF